MKTPLEQLIEYSDKENTNKVHIVREDFAIIDYLLDTKKHHIVQAWDTQEKDENTGVGMFFNEKDYTNLIIVICTKFIEYNEEKGLLLLIIEDIHKNTLGVSILQKIISMIFEDERDPLITKKINHQIDEYVNIAINFHARD